MTFYGGDNDDDTHYTRREDIYIGPNLDNRYAAIVLSVVALILLWCGISTLWGTAIGLLIIGSIIGVIAFVVGLLAYLDPSK